MAKKRGKPMDDEKTPTADAPSEEAAADETPIAAVATPASDALELTTPAQVTEALGAPAGPPGLDLAATALDLASAPPATPVVIPLPGAKETDEERAARQVTEIATHGHHL